MRYVAVVVEDFSDYQHQLLLGLRDELASVGSGVLVLVRAPRTSERGGAGAWLADALLTCPVVLGLVVTPLGHRDEESRLADLARARGLPLVGVARPFAEAPGIGCDNEPGMTALMAHLLDECRVRRPVLLGGDDVNIDAMQREAIVRRELVMRGVAFSERRRLAGRLQRLPARAAVRRLLERGIELDALIAVNDAMALGALDAVRDAGLRVPDDVRISGFDDVPASAAADVTTVAQDLRGQGVAAARTVTDLAAGRHARDVLVLSSLVVRGSTVVRGLASPPAARAAPLDAAGEGRSGELRRRLSSAASRAEVSGELEALLPPAGLGRPVLLPTEQLTPAAIWQVVDSLGPCVAIQELAAGAGALVYDPAGLAAPDLAEVLKRDLSQVLTGFMPGGLLASDTPPAFG